MINTGHRVQDYAPPDKLLQLIEYSVKTSVETAHGLVTFQCRRIVEGLKLAEGRQFLIPVSAVICSVLVFPGDNLSPYTCIFAA